MTHELTSGGMKLDRFKAIIEAYGANAAHWPAAEREAAEAFAATSPDAIGLLAEARALDLLLDEAPLMEATSDLTSRILASVPRVGGMAPATAPQSRGWADQLTGILNVLWPRHGLARPAGLLAATMMFGFLVGFSGAGGAAAADTEDSDVFAYVFGSPVDVEWDLGDLQ